MKEDGAFIFLASVVALVAVCVLAGTFFGFVAAIGYRVFQMLT